MTLPAPEPGLVISYAYLWHDEYEAGKDEGRKDRPAAIVLTTERKDDSARNVLRKVASETLRSGVIMARANALGR